VGGGYFTFFMYFFGVNIALYFCLSLLPTILFFLWWFWKTTQNKENANFQNTMYLNFLSALGMNIFFYSLFFSKFQKQNIV
jgi:1,4-dihydroxy-2-naphthoate octaprenyltransferase